MGLFSLIGDCARAAGRAAGRAVGRGIEWLGEKTHNETLQEVGRQIQYECSKIARKTGETNEYDQETASEWETERMADILADFSKGLEEQAVTLETGAKEQIESYFDGIIAAIEGVSGRCATTRNLRASKRTILDTIPGSLSTHLATRVALSDKECCQILKMPKGAEKERKMEAFGRKVIREGLSNLCKRIDAALDQVSSAISEECDSLAAQQRKELENFKAQVEETMASLSRDETSTEETILEPAKKLSAGELVLDVWNREASA